MYCFLIQIRGYPEALCGDAARRNYLTSGNAETKFYGEAVVVVVSV